jgi:hypothetical protein
MAAGIVILGLIAAGLVSAIEGRPDGPLPGVALGSVMLLLVERAIGFFAAWMAVVVVVAQALKGHLPIEVSGQGVRYATAENVGETLAWAEEVGRRHDIEIAQIREAMVTLDERLPGLGEEID